MRWVKTYVVCLLLMIAGTGNAQRLPIVDYTTRFSVLANGVLQTFQDSKGWIWWVSGEEVMRYNGVALTILQPAAGVAMDFCYQVIEVNDNIIVNGKPYSLIVDGDSLRSVPGSMSNYIVDAQTKHHNREYVLSKRGLAVVDNSQVKSYINCHFTKDLSSSLLPFQDSLLVGHLAFDSLLIFNLNSKRLYEIPYHVKDIAVANNRSIVVLTDKGLQQVQDIIISGNTVINKDSILLAKKIPGTAMISTDNAGTIWLGIHHDGLYKISPGTSPKKFAEKDISPGLAFNDLFHDREDNTWIAMANGLLKVPPTKALYYTSADGLAFNVTEDLYAHDNLLYATTLKGLSVFSNGQWTTLNWQGKPFVCQQIIENNRGLFCLVDDEVYRIEIDVSNSKVISKTLVADLPAHPTDLVSDRYGNLYISTHHSVWITRNNKLSKLPLPDSAYRVLYIDSHERLWCGQFGGPLDVLQLNNDSPVASLQALTWNKNIATQKPLAVRSIVEDKAGKIVVGTRFNGLYQLNITGGTIQSYKHISSKEGLPADAVWDIAVDKNNSYWMVNDGITMVHTGHEKWQVREVGKWYHINRAYKINYQHEDKIWVSTPEGLIAFNPTETFKHSGTEIKTMITGVWMNDDSKLDTAKQSIHLQHDQNNLLIEFSTNSFIQEDLINYSYSFSNNSDDHWSKPSTDNSVRFSAIAPGKYFFRVKAFDSYGNVVGNIAGRRIIVAPPFYATWWFVMLCTLIALAIIYFVYRLRMRQVKRLMTIRNNISQNLHDDIGASLTNILLLNEMARKQAGNAEASAPLLNRATEDIRRIGESLGDIVWNINPNNDQLANVMAKMQRYAGEMLEGADIQARLDFPEELPNEKMQMDQRRDVYLLFKELIHNITKHADATEATVKIGIEDRKIKLQVCDNGKGFDFENGTSHNGLRNIQDRVNKWKGTMAVKSTAGKGTLVEIMMPFMS